MTVLPRVPLRAATFCLAALVLAGDVGAAPDEGAGCLYGTVTAEDGRVVTGFLRTSNDDAFWDDILRLTRREFPWADAIDEEALARQRRADYFRDHGLFDRLAYVLSGSDRESNQGRQFLCRYGQVARIDLDDDEAIVETTDGVAHRCRRRGTDLRGELTVAGETSAVIDWDEVTTVVFAAVPTGAAPPWRRLAGRVVTDGDTLQGYVQWDRTECTDDGILDGEQDREDHDVPMGDIAAIAKERDGSRVTLRDGRSLFLTGTNDVNADNRGIAVEVAGFGRVIVPWQRFVRVDFAVPGPSGPGRDAYEPGAELRGDLELADGATASGRLVWDLDEGWTWDILNGERDGVEYEIPFAAIVSVTRTDAGSRLELLTGRSVELTGGQDGGDANRGLLVQTDEGWRQVPWVEVATVRFAP